MNEGERIRLDRNRGPYRNRGVNSLGLLVNMHSVHSGCDRAAIAQVAVSDAALAKLPPGVTRVGRRRLLVDRRSEEFNPLVAFLAASGRAGFGVYRRCRPATLHVGSTLHPSRIHGSRSDLGSETALATCRAAD